MHRQEVLNLLAHHRDELNRLGVESLALFGSLARDEANSTSDVDMLVEFSPPATYDRYIGLKHFLEDTLGCDVDLVTRKALKARIRSTVEREAIRVA